MGTGPPGRRLPHTGLVFAVFSEIETFRRFSSSLAAFHRKRAHVCLQCAARAEAVRATVVSQRMTVQNYKDTHKERRRRQRQLVGAFSTNEIRTIFIFGQYCDPCISYCNTRTWDLRTSSAAGCSLTPANQSNANATIQGLEQKVVAPEMNHCLASRFVSVALVISYLIQ